MIPPVRTEAATDFDLEVELERAELIHLLDQALELLPAETRHSERCADPAAR